MYYSHLHLFFVAKIAKIRPEKHILAAQGACLVSETHIR